MEIQFLPGLLCKAWCDQSFVFPALLGHSFVLPICCAVALRALPLLGFAVFGSVIETSATALRGTIYEYVYDNM